MYDENTSLTPAITAPHTYGCAQVDRGSIHVKLEYMLLKALVRILTGQQVARHALESRAGLPNRHVVVVAAEVCTATAKRRLTNGTRSTEGVDHQVIFWNL